RAWLWLCLGSAWHNGPYANLTVVQSPAEVGVIRGNNATLNCTFSRGLSLDKGAVSWSRGGPGGEAAVPLRARFALAYPETFLRRGEGTLAITNVSLEDAGKYVCRVLLWGTGEARGNGTQLRVYGKGSCLHPPGKAAGSQLHRLLGFRGARAIEGTETWRGGKDLAWVMQMGRDPRSPAPLPSPVLTTRPHSSPRTGDRTQESGLPALPQLQQLDPTSLPELRENPGVLASSPATLTLTTRLPSPP
uniref:Natural cytotoxicity triggering receptor 3 n=1 Tax=Gopherus agassizii TaxID=38772 RepID=A0A452H1C4_9SAUR